MLRLRESPEQQPVAAQRALVGTLTAETAEKPGGISSAMSFGRWVTQKPRKGAISGAEILTVGILRIFHHVRIFCWDKEKKDQTITNDSDPERPGRRGDGIRECPTEAVPGQ